MPEVARLTLTRSFLLLAVCVLLFDQATKHWALGALFAPSQQIKLLPFFWLTPVWNSGVSFGLFADQVMLVKGLVPVLAVVVIAWLYWQLAALSALQRLAAGLISGGAAGNVIDRLRFGKVIDFLDFHLFGYHWPAFNIADSAIFIGVVLWLYGIMRAPEQEGNTDE